MNAAVQNKKETFRQELSTLFEQHNRLLYKAAGCGPHAGQIIVSLIEQAAAVLP